MMAEQKRAAGFSTPSSGRKWGPKASKTDGYEYEDAAGVEDLAMSAALGRDGDGGGDGGGRHDLTIKLMEEELKMMKEKMNDMKKANDDLKAENDALKKSIPQQQNQDNKEKHGGGEDSWWKKGGRWDDDPWKDWKGRDDTMNKGNDCVNDDGKWDQKFERVGKDDWGARVWWGGRIDRRNEMVARGFKRNTYWKEINSKVEEVMGKSRVTNGGVKVIGQMASFAIIRFDEYESHIGASFRM
jgi:hypothetical protein